MERQKRPARAYPTQSGDHNLSSAAIPHSNLVDDHGSTTSIAAGPRYFSSPFRAPLNQKARHDSFAEHQKSISNVHEHDHHFPDPKFLQSTDRTSYTFFEPQTESEASGVSNKHKQTLRSNYRANSPTEPSPNHLGVVRQASIGHKAKPALREIRQSDSPRTNKTYIEPKTPPLAATTIDALNSAIAANNGNFEQDQNRPPLSRNTSTARMPFDSPTSTYSQDFQQWRKSQYRSSRMGMDPNMPSPSEEHFQTPEQHEGSSPLARATPYSEKSVSSTNPLLGLGIEDQKANKRISDHLRPPRLDMKTVQEQDARGSMTSLPDLIRRATRLASNLDRGKTASRLGILDLLREAEYTNNNHQGPSDAKKRESTLSEVLNSFPDPATGTPTRSPYPPTDWQHAQETSLTESEKQRPAKERQPKPKKPARKCCGMSLTWFIIVVIILIILTAAAVLIPVFLTIIPRQNRIASANLSDCGSSHPCLNSGISVVDSNACSCVCVNGFTGSDCSKPTDFNCGTVNLSDHGHIYENATVGSSIRSLVAQSDKMNIPLNASILLSTFAINNLSCASENSLVQFNLENAQKSRRLVIVPGLEPKLEMVHNIPVPTRLSSSGQVGNLAAIHARDTETLNNIVFQASSTQLPTASPASVTPSTAPPPAQPSVVAATSTLAPAAATTSAAATASTSIANQQQSAKANITSEQTDFAGLVVLYVLIESRVPSTAVNAQQNIAQYFHAGGLGSGNVTVPVATVGNLQVTANFSQLSIVLSDGKVIGGRAGLR